MLERFVIYNLDVSIPEVWEEIPVGYYREIIPIAKQNEDKQVPVIIKGIEKGDNKFLAHIKSTFGITTDMQFEKMMSRNKKCIRAISRAKYI